MRSLHKIMKKLEERMKPETTMYGVIAIIQEEKLMLDALLTDSDEYYAFLEWRHIKEQDADSHEYDRLSTLSIQEKIAEFRQDEQRKGHKKETAFTFLPTRNEVEMSR